MEQKSEKEALVNELTELIRKKREENEALNKLREAISLSEIEKTPAKTQNQESEEINQHE